MTSTHLPASPATSVVAATPLVATTDAHAAAIAAAKRRWLQACADGSSSAQVQWLYSEYRDLVISRVAAAVQGRAASAS